MIYNYVSSKEMLAKIARDLKPTNFDWEEDVLEWIGEALEFIGSGAAYERKRKTLLVHSYRAALPADLMELIGVFNADEKAYTFDHVEYLDTGIQQTSKGTWIELPKDGYFINGGYIIMPFAEGEITIEYEGFKTDLEGFPMIPDSVHYRNAIFWYVLRQMILGGFKHPDPHMTYFNADEQWKRYCAQASVKGGFPSVDKAMNFGKTFVSLVPTVRIKRSKLSDIDNV